MRALFKLILWLLFLSPFALGAMAWFALSEDPLVLNNTRLSHKDIARARMILKQNDPRRIPAGTKRQIILSEYDLNLAVNHLLQKAAEGGAQVRVHEGAIDAIGTLRVPGLPYRPFLNISFELVDDRGNLDVRKLSLGAVNFPPALARFFLSQALRQLYQKGGFELASNLVSNVRMQPRELQFTYRHDPVLLARARSTLIDFANADALNAYHARLLQLQAQGIGVRGPLAELLTPLFRFAEERSRERDPVAENQALLMLLGAWSSNHGLAQLVPDAPGRPNRFRLSLQKRVDFGQHFLTSAALAARGDGDLADAIGLAKEIADSDGGSGFSFTDIAADRAGARFGELATSSEREARMVQAFMAKGADEHDIMPPARDLPEHMGRTEFERRFGDIGSPAYEAMMQEIETRLSNCRLYRIQGRAS